MSSLDTLSRQSVQAVLDAMALRGLEDGGGGFLTTSDPRTYMSADRLQLAKTALRMLPAGATLADAHRLAKEIAPRLAASIGAIGKSE